MAALNNASQSDGFFVPCFAVLRYATAKQSTTKPQLLAALCEQGMEVTNPTVVEVRLWAYSEDEWPQDEWDLFLSWTREVDLFIELATDHKCPKQNFFLHMLYYIIGITYSEPSKTDKIDRIKSYSEKGSGIKHGAIREWRSNIKDLLDNKVKYGYDNWRGGVFAGYKFT